jgi:ankyrin repeat protein
MASRLVVRLSLPLVILSGMVGCGTGNNPLHNAAMIGGPEELEIAMRQPGALVNAENRTHNTPLHEAVLHDNEPAVRWLLAHNANVGARDEDGDTPLHFAADKGFADVAEDLIKAKADVNARNLSRSTPLHKAADRAATDVCKLLVEHGALVNAKDVDGDTPLHQAAASGSSGDEDAPTTALKAVSVETVEYLLSKGADPNIRNLAGLTPRMKALEGGNRATAQALARHTAK